MDNPAFDTFKKLGAQINDSKLLAEMVQGHFCRRITHIKYRFFINIYIYIYWCEAEVTKLANLKSIACALHLCKFSVRFLHFVQLLTDSIITHPIIAKTFLDFGINDIICHTDCSTGHMLQARAALRLLKTFNHEYQSYIWIGQNMNSIAAIFAWRRMTIRTYLALEHFGFYQKKTLPPCF